MSEPRPAAVAPRALPLHPNLDHLRGQAKTLLDALVAGEPTTRERLKQHVPHREEPWQLADAQLTIAREYGFASWPKLVAHVESLSAASVADAMRATFVRLLHAGDIDGLRSLLRDAQARALVNAPLGNFGARPASFAKSNAALLDLLIEHGADINLKSDWPAGPWGLLETATPVEAELLLSRGATIDIHAASNLDRVDLAKAMLEADPTLVHARGGDGCRPLHFARSAAMMDLLLSHGAEIDARDVDHESTALQWALPRPDAGEGGVRPAGSMERVRLLAERGATVDIFAAAALDDVALVRRALEAHASARTAHVNAPGYPPCPVSSSAHIYTYTLGGGMMAYAVAAAFNSEKAMAILMEHASRQERFFAASLTGRAADAIALLREDPSLPEALTPTQQAALPSAAWNSNESAVTLMLDIGFDPAATGPEGGNVLHCAAWRGLAELVERVLSHPRVRPHRDAMIVAKDATFSSTPLGWCCHGSTNCRNPKGDYPRVAKALIAAGAVPGPNLNDATPDVRAAINAQTERQGTKVATD